MFKLFNLKCTDNAIRISTKSTNKYRYQANRSFILGRVKAIFPRILFQILDLSAIDRLYSESVRCRSQIIPGRSFHRQKSKTYGRNHYKKLSLKGLLKCAFFHGFPCIFSMIKLIFYRTFSCFVS